MSGRKRTAVIVAAVAMGTLGACVGGNEQTRDPKAVKIGVITSLSGPLSGGYAGVEGGIEARLRSYEDAGGTCASTDIDVVMGDDRSTPQGALAATQKLKQQDGVYALLPVSAAFFGAAQFASTLTETPVIGSSDGGPQWLDPKANNNFFSSLGSFDVRNISSTFGDYWHSLGGTKAAVVGFDTPSSGPGALAAMESATDTGLERGYVNVKVPIGTTDVGSVVLGIKNSGADVLYLAVTPQTGTAIVAGLREAGVKPTSTLLATGYGADLLASPPAVAAAEGVGFITTTFPSEIDNEATRTRQSALKKYAGAKNGTTFSQVQGWLAAELFLHGLEAAGCDASASDYITALRDTKDWDAGGLYPKPVDFSKFGNVAGAHGPGNCMFVSIMRKGAFAPDPAASPLCGESLGKVKG